MYEKYIEEVMLDMQNNPKWRYGQTLFNTLYKMHPAIADKIRGTKFDPFYSNTTDLRVQTFLEYVKTNLSN